MLFSKQLKVISSEAVDHDTKLVTFALPRGTSSVSGLPPGSAILTQHSPAGSSFPVLRPYTPVNDLETPGILQLLVKKYPGGRASGHMHSLTPGDELTVRGPIPSYYDWEPSTTPREVLFTAGGAGITPIYSLARGVLRTEGDRTRIHLLWAVNSAQDVLLQDQLKDLKDTAGESSMAFCEIMFQQSCLYCRQMRCMDLSCADIRRTDSPANQIRRDSSNSISCQLGHQRTTSANRFTVDAQRYYYCIEPSGG